MKTYYVDTSVVVRALLGHSRAAAVWLRDASTNDELVSSRLLKTELTRVLRQEGLDVSERETVLRDVSIIPLDHAVLTEAEAIGPHIHTLDAIHLASALRSGIEDLVIASHDERMLSVAHELGLETMDPVTDCPGGRRQR